MSRTTKNTVSSIQSGDALEKEDAHAALPFVDASEPGRRRRTKEERGLPDEGGLGGLAEVYLECQRRLWPNLAEAELLPAFSPEAISDLIAQFKLRFVADSPVDVEFWNSVRVDLAAAYARYSDSDSNPRSLAQQLRLQLERARANNQFIPWAYVFADAGVTGTTSARRDYQKLKCFLARPDCNVATLYVDELGRANRDTGEMLDLAKLLVNADRRLLGVSDGFDTNSPMWKILLSIIAAYHEYFIDQLRSKVNRGMDDAFDLGANLHPPAFGYELVPLVDKHGRPITGKDGEQLNTRAIKKAEAKWVIRAFLWYVKKLWSPDRIAREFCLRSIGGRSNWDGPAIRRLLRRYVYAGIRVFRTVYYTRDAKTGKVTTHRRPRSEWRVRRERKLKIVRYWLWKAAQKRLKVRSDAWTKQRSGGPRRSELQCNRLFRPICKHCKSVLHCGLNGKYNSYWCPNGAKGKNGCPFKGYKSATIVETALLSYLRTIIVTPENTQRIVDKANEFLAKAKAAPRTKTKPIERELRNELAIVDRYHSLFKGGADVESTVRHLRHHEANVKSLRTRLSEANARNAAPPPALTGEDIRPILNQLQDLLNKEVTVAAPLLKELTGPIVVDQILEKGQEKPTWIASFSVNLVPVLARLAASNDHRVRETLEYLRGRNSIVPLEVAVPLDYALPSQEMQERVLSSRAKGTSINAIATVVGLNWQTVKLICENSNSTESHDYRIQKPRRCEGTRTPKYISCGPAIVRLKDDEELSFDEIGERLHINPSTAVRGYNRLRPEQLNAAFANGSSVKRNGGRRLPRTKYAIIGKLLDAGERSAEVIAAAAGCSKSTVRREFSRRGLVKSREQRQAERLPAKPKKPLIRPRDYVDVVVRMHDVEKLSFSEIARRLKICERTVRKAYDLGRPDILMAAIATGEPPRRSIRSRISAAKKARIREMVQGSERTSAIMAETGCSYGSVRIARLRFLRELIAKRRPNMAVAELAARSGCRAATVQLELRRARKFELL